MKEWLLVIWLGTSSNFMVSDVFWNREQCNRAREALLPTLGTGYVVVCTQDMREGRSQYPKSSLGIGVAK
jgi:hypothetical protein